MKRILVIICTLYSALVYVGCSNDKVADVSTVETENACLIQVVRTDSLPAANLLARVRSVNYLPVVEELQDSQTCDAVVEYTTDSLGRFVVSDSVAELFEFGDVAVEIIDGGVGAFAEVKLKNAGEKEVTADTNLVATMTLEKLGAVRGRIVFPEDSANATPLTIWVRISGTDRLVKADADGYFEIDSLPPYKYYLVFESALYNFSATVIIESGKTNDMGLLKEGSIGFRVEEIISDWMESAIAARKNGETVVGFIRLDSTNFDFDNVLKGGADVTFGWHGEHNALHFIDYWNDSLKSARVQVKIPADVDSVFLLWNGVAFEEKDHFFNFNEEKSIWNGVSAEVAAEQNSVTLIDFENGFASALQKPALTNEWQLGWQGDSVVATTPVLDSAGNGLEKAGAGRDGTAFHWKSESKNGSWSYIGLWISEPQRKSDLSAMDSVEFYIRGNGPYSFAFESQGEGSLHGKALYHDSVNTDEWKRVALKPSDFVEGDSTWGNLGWDMVRHLVTNINISAYRKAELWIDDIKIYGANLDDLK